MLILFWEAGCLTEQVFFLLEGHHSDQILVLWQEKNDNKPAEETNKKTIIKIMIMKQ